MGTGAGERGTLNTFFTGSWPTCWGISILWNKGLENTKISGTLNWYGRALFRGKYMLYAHNVDPTSEDNQKSNKKQNSSRVCPRSGSGCRGCFRTFRSRLHRKRRMPCGLTRQYGGEQRNGESTRSRQVEKRMSNQMSEYCKPQSSRIFLFCNKPQND